MKHFLLFILCAFLLIRLDAQTITENRSEDTSNFKLGIGTGFDNFTGFVGVSGTLNIYDNISVRGGFGLSSWGTKSSIGLKIDSRNGGKYSYNLGYSASSGADDLPLDLELSNGETREVKVDLLSASTLNLAIDRNWKIGRSNIFYLEFGYAIPLQSRKWNVVDDSNISTNAEKVMDIMQPGGIIFGLGFAFGL
jgi:hypothetical protein